MGDGGRSGQTSWHMEHATTIQFGALHQRRLTISRLRWYVLGAQHNAYTPPSATTVFNHAGVHRTRKSPLETRNSRLETNASRTERAEQVGYVLAVHRHDPSYLDLSDLSDFSGRYRPSSPPPSLSFYSQIIRRLFPVSSYFPPRYLLRLFPLFPSPLLHLVSLHRTT